MQGPPGEGREAGGDQRSRSEASARAARMAALAAVIYATWAFIANVSHGAWIAARSAGAQALWSAALTLTMSTLMEWSAVRARARGIRVLWAAAPAIALAWVGPPTVHWLIRTPEILRTIIPGITVGTLFSLAYARGIERAIHRVE